MIIIKDALRSRIESESQGRRTVLYTASGQPNYMYVMPRFTLDEVASGLGQAVHPAFVVNGKEKSEFFYGCYPGSLHHGELLSLPDEEPASWLDLAAFRQAAARNGAGWHLGTNAEWAALMFWCRHHQWLEQGNTDYGRSVQNHDQIGRRLDGAPAGEQQGQPTTLSASGPAAWYHDGSVNGIGDLCGNLWEWQLGLRLIAGEIQILPDNDAAMPWSDETEARWRAIDLDTGLLLPPGAENSAKFDASTPKRDGNAGVPVINARIRNFNGDPQDNGYPPGLMDAAFDQIERKGGAAAPNLLKILGIIPHHRSEDGDQVYLRNYGERILMRGGAWYSNTAAGMRTLCLSHGPKHASATVGARPVWCL
ncbi:TPA: hypothetical protein LLS86_000333 [Serratia liquefaciens]|nr:hypothetical protein [Serratia liquefaciens]